MMNRRSALKKSPTLSEVILKRSATTAKARATQSPLTSGSESTTKFTKRSQSDCTIPDQYDHHRHNRPQLVATSENKHSEQKGKIDEYPFPQSPDLIDPIGIMNSNHPQHKMVQVNLPNPFTCMGCKEYGAGTRFTCQQCNFELHDFCALAPPVLKAHPLHSQHQLLFYPKPPGKGLLRGGCCDVCGKAAKGYLFKCSACSFQLHPCCALLSAKMKLPMHPHALIMLPATNLGGGDGVLCGECKRKRSGGQLYQCTVCDYYLHAVCAKTMVNGLRDNGLKGLNDKPNSNRVLGVAAKLASQVVFGFMGGIVEGLGEGLGEALTQNFAKGRCNSSPTTRSHISGSG